MRSVSRSKAEGVYYTPVTVVDGMVQQMLDRLLAGKTWRQFQAQPPRILEPSCGEGIFLLRVYQYLLDWYRDQLLQQSPEVWGDQLVQDCEGNWQLAIAVRQWILLNCIFGVDIDAVAIEVAQTALIQQLNQGFQESESIDLSHNLKCGNSLMGIDLELEEAQGFDWAIEFPEILASGGFDGVIGNPPYVDSAHMQASLKLLRKYCIHHYQTAVGNWDLFCVFIEKAIALCKSEGLVCLIVPNKLGSATYAASVRALIAQQNCLLLLQDYSQVEVFPVAVYPLVFLVQKSLPVLPQLVIYEKMSLGENQSAIAKNQQNFQYEYFLNQPQAPWSIFTELTDTHWCDRIQVEYPSLQSVAEILGAATVSEAYAIQDLIEEGSEFSDDLKVLNSGTIDRYHGLWGLKELRYLGRYYLHPVISQAQQLKLPHKRLQQASHPKLILAGMTQNLECVVDLTGVWLAGKSTTIVFSSLNLLYLLALLNSSLMTAYYQARFGGDRFHGGYLRIGPPQVRQLPIRVVKKTEKLAWKLHEKIILAVQEILYLYQKLPDVSEKLSLKKQIELWDEKINQWVYELYGLSDEEQAAIATSLHTSL